ncbi:MAG TPA: hypothetical protein VIB00_16630, partial [Pyrinomonadaceae bacterium]
YTTVGRLVLHTRLLREDGALSILRSFKPAELAELASRAELTEIDVRRSFPFRVVLRARRNPVAELQSETGDVERIRLAS